MEGKPVSPPYYSQMLQFQGWDFMVLPQVIFNGSALLSEIQ
jgi:hypothetical protein